MFGGCGVKIFNELEVHFIKRNYKKKLKKEIFKRYANAFVKVNKFLIFHGGKTKHLDSTKPILCDVQIVNLENLQVSMVRTYPLNMPFRYSHICFYSKGKFYI